MKKTLLVALVMMLGVTAFAQEGKMAVGLNVNYGTKSGYNQIGFGAKLQYEFIQNLRGEASFNYFLPKEFDYGYGTKVKGLSFYDININAHYLFNIDENLRVYPLAGLSYETLAFTGDLKKAVESIGADSSESKIGVNLGGGIEYQLSDNFKLNAEVKYQTQMDWWVLGVGVAYSF